MKDLFNPIWVLLVTTLPSIILAALVFRSYNIFHTLLAPSHRELWSWYFIIFLVLTTSTFGYSIFKIKRNQRVTIIYALLTLTFYAMSLYGFAFHMDILIPRSVPGWLSPESLTYYAGSFLMPSLLYSLFLIVDWSVDKEKPGNSWFSLLYAFCIPLGMYFFFIVILPLWQPTGSGFHEHSIVIAVVMATIVFLFFFLRWIYLIICKKGKWKYNHIGYRVTLGIVFPLLGLLINNGILNQPISFGSGVFGDFTSYWFYGLAILNGIFLCLKPNQSPQYRLAIFVGRSITYPYILYFFLVFMPYIPLSVLIILLFGLGLLMLTPIALLIIQTYDLFHDYQSLQSHFSKLRLKLLAISAMSILPLAITFSYLSDKNTLTQTLDAIYSPDYSEPAEIDIISLSATIAHIKSNRSQNNQFSSGDRKPFLSSYFSWLVLDNMTLSNDKIRKIENIYFGASTTKSRTSLNSDAEVSISGITSSSTYDPDQGAWESWIDLELTNNSMRNFAEYGTRIYLPDGCWIGDYYLFVEGKKEMGILAEKKSAMWVYSQIRNLNKDPGLLNYTSGNEVAFRVFPFGSNVTRKTGIQFLHRDPVTIKIDDKVVELGDAEVYLPSQNQTVNSGNAMYISANEKANLPKISRTPYFHFIVDVSLGRESKYQNSINSINSVLDTYPHIKSNAKITFTNFLNKTFDYSSNWQSQLKSYKYEGGFHLEHAIKKTLFDSYQSQEKSSPHVVVITDNINSSIIEKNFADFKITFPENDLFYCLDSDDALVAHSLTKNPKKALKNQPIILDDLQVYCWPDAAKPKAYLSIDDNPSVILNEVISPTKEPSNSKWASALKLQGMWLSQCLYPKSSKDQWIDLVKGSFKSRVLTPLTSFIVVENEAQKAMLQRKQDQVLKGDKNMDLSGDVRAMSEPSIWIFLLILAGVLLYRNRFMVY